MRRTFPVYRGHFAARSERYCDCRAARPPCPAALWPPRQKPAGYDKRGATGAHVRPRPAGVHSIYITHRTLSRRRQTCQTAMASGTRGSGGPSTPRQPPSARPCRPAPRQGAGRVGRSAHPVPKGPPSDAQPRLAHPSPNACSLVWTRLVPRIKNIHVEVPSIPPM